ncbi:Sulfotransferase domain-containing protein [Candidatus Electrothrix laxa]
MSKVRKPILVTGSHRSGTTWAGKNLSLAPHTGYIHEPFNVGKKINYVKKPFSYWFQYICEENAFKHKEVLDNVIHYQYPLFGNLTKIRTLRNAARVFISQGLTFVHKIKNDSPIVKDPIAFFSADWLCKTYRMNVLVLIRHPAAFCSSLKIKNWTFDFNNFLNQRLLMDRYLYVFEKEIREFAQEEKHVIEQAILLWNCIYHTVKVYQQEHPEWLFVRHEDLSNDPLGEFEAIYRKFDLEFTPSVQSRILENSGSHNPTEQQAGNEFKRNSKDNILNWKKRLSSEEIESIKAKTKNLSNEFYEDYEW